MSMEHTLLRIARELRNYNPAADEYNGAHVHKHWAGEIESLLATVVPSDAYADAVATMAAFKRYAGQQGYDLTTCEETNSISSSDGTAIATFLSGRTEHAWRGWANRPVALRVQSGSGAACMCRSPGSSTQASEETEMETGKRMVTDSLVNQAAERLAYKWLFPTEPTEPANDMRQAQALVLQQLLACRMRAVAAQGIDPIGMEIGDLLPHVKPDEISVDGGSF